MERGVFVFYPVSMELYLNRAKKKKYEKRKKKTIANVAIWNAHSTYNTP